MATASVTYTFVPETTILASEANINFANLVNFLNSNVIQKDASLAFTNIPSGPASDPTTANQFTRKAYVDAATSSISSTVTSGLLARAKFPNASMSGYSGSVNLSTTQPIIQAGSVAGTTNGTGYLSISFPSAFPTGILTVILTNGDQDAATYGLTTASGVSTSGFSARAVNPNSGGAYTNQGVRFNYIAIGW